MSGDTSVQFDVLTLSEAELVDQACDRFETAWRKGDWPCIEAYLDAVAGRCRTTLLHELIKLELELRMKVGEEPTAIEYRRRFPDHAQAIEAIIALVNNLRDPRSTLPDDVLGSEVPDPNAITVDFRTLGVDPRNAGELPMVDGALGRLLGEYVILDRLGSGGMGVVYRAFQRNANRLVALKLIKAEWFGDSTEGGSREAERRFQTEAKVLARLEHDHIVPLYDAGHAEGLLFFSMRLINGRSLGQIVLSDGPLAPRRAAYYLEAIARAIQYAHENKIVHRDVKPGNILVGENDRPYLIDLGLARSLDATDFTTLTGKALGTAEYMAPEQARGDEKIGFEADVYGLGATLFALLTGRPPFTGPNPVVVLRKVIDEEPIWPRDRDKPVGLELKAICLKCLEKSPADRFQTAGELAVVLKKYLTYEPTGVVRPGLLVRLGKWARRQPWRAAAACLAVLVVVLTGAAVAWNARRNSMIASLLVRDIQTVPLDSLPDKIDKINGLRFWADPQLAALARERPGERELHARVALALLPTEPSRATELTVRMLECPIEEFRIIRDALREHRQAVVPVLDGVLADARAEPGRRTRAAAALIAWSLAEVSKTPSSERAWDELRLAPEPDNRVALLDWLIVSKLDATLLADRLNSEPEISVRRQLIQALGGLGNGTIPAEVSGALVEKLMGSYRDDPDPGIHSSLAYLFRRWGLGAQVNRIDSELAGGPRGGREWYVTPAGLTMAVIDVPAFAVPDAPVPGQAPPRIAIATTETPLALFEQFDPGHATRRLEGSGLKPADRPGAPADALSYFDAARFCNWLSDREGISAAEWCYHPGKTPGVMILDANYRQRRGYRLPTMAEWELAVRAGTRTDRYFGTDVSRADNYAWHQSNTHGSAQPVGQLRPNDFGLFDAIGNLMEHCHNPVTRFFPNCAVCPGPISGTCELRLEAVKGGAFLFAAERLRVVDRVPRGGFDYEYMQPDMPLPFFGFRIARNDL